MRTLITAAHSRPVQYSQDHAYRQEAPTRLPHSFLAEGPRASRALSASRASSSPNSTGSSPAWPSPCRGRSSGRRDHTCRATIRACGLWPARRLGFKRLLMRGRRSAPIRQKRVKTRRLRRKRTPFATSGQSRRPNQPQTPQHAGVSPQVEINPLVKGDGVTIAPCLPIASYARLHQEPLALVVAVVFNFRRKRRSRAYDAHPFCQDEKTRLPAEMLRLDSRTICFLEFEPPDFCSSFRPSSTMNQLRKAAFESDRKSSHRGRFPMGRFFASTSTYT